MSSFSGWVKSWSHCYNSCAKENIVVDFCDMPYVQCYEETDYQRLLTDYDYNAEDR